MAQHRNLPGATGYRGVYYEPRKRRFRARIGLEGKQVHVGRYRTAVEAARAYNEAARELFGDKALLNKLPDSSNAEKTNFRNA